MLGTTTKLSVLFQVLGLERNILRLRCKWKTEDNGRREITLRLPRIETSLASQTHFREKGKSPVNWLRLHGMHSPSFFEKVGLAYETRKEAVNSERL